MILRIIESNYKLNFTVDVDQPYLGKSNLHNLGVFLIDFTKSNTQQSINFNVTGKLGI